ncbi:MAG TPA: helix-turn-helix domain-containing protein, partial [Candidatus Paceibacterota bacterium]|nr:helix-turn-helix domain-containing protein [Candidatus Paceibacterota bacterium]
MNASLPKNLITTKHAGELSGYAPDYLSRLARSGKISGRRVGHNWLVDKTSLEQFLKNQAGRKKARAHSLAQMRAKEYHSRASVQRSVPEAEKETEPVSTPKAYVPRRPFVPPRPIVRIDRFRAEPFAIAAACLVLIASAAVARAAFIPQLASGFGAAVENSATTTRAALAAGATNAARQLALVEDDASHASLGAYLTFVNSTGASLYSTAVATTRLPHVVNSMNLALGAAVINVSHAALGADLALTYALAADGPASAHAIVAFAGNSGDALERTVARAPALATSAYLDIARAPVLAAGATLEAYRMLVGGAGASTYAAARSTYGALAAFPRFVSSANLAFGNAVITAAHAAIRADTSLAYGLAAAGPASARVTVALVGTAGAGLERAAANTPAFAVSSSMRLAAVPAAAAPALARAAIGADYAFGRQFLSVIDSMNAGYLALVNGTGQTLAANYMRAIRAPLYVSATGVQLAWLSPAAENAYLGALGKSAVAVDSAAASVNAAVAPATRTSAQLAAAAGVSSFSTLSASERAALFTYDTINGAVQSAGDYLAGMFGHTPSVAVTSNPPSAVLPFATSTTLAMAPSQPIPVPVPAPQPEPSAQPSSHIAISYPTYTTVVNGVSQTQLDQSLAALRMNILNAVSGMIQPVASQTATNVTTIQQVNMIQNLSDLTAHDATINGNSIFNGSYVQANVGRFAQLYATSTATKSLAVTGTATTTFGGPINVSGTIYVNGSPLAGGGSGIVNSGSTGQIPYYAANGPAVSATSSLFIAPSGNVGIGTTSPSQRLSVKGNGLFSGSISANSLALTNALPVASGGTGTSTAPAYGDVLLGNSAGGYDLVATSSLGISGGSGTNYWTLSGGNLYDNSGTNIGIGTTSPFAKLSVNGSAYVSGNLTATGTATAANIVDTGVSAGALLYANASKQLTSATVSGPLSLSGGALAIAEANGTTNGYLSSADWNLFNDKVSSTSLSAVTPLAYNPSTGVFTLGTVPVNKGGTGLSTAPAYGQVLVGNSSGGYTLTSTSSLGISGGGGPTYTFTYPLTNASNIISLAFGTTTANTWGAVQTFTNAPILGALSGLVGSNNGHLYQIATSTS